MGVGDAFGVALPPDISPAEDGHIDLVEGSDAVFFGDLAGDGADAGAFTCDCIDVGDDLTGGDGDVGGGEEIRSVVVIPVLALVRVENAIGSGWQADQGIVAVGG